MKKLILFVSGTVLALAACAAGTHADESKTLTGSYVWEQRAGSGPLEAVFTPTGEGSWDVDFNFEFRGRAHTYSGTARGSLTEGKLEGLVFNEKKKRSFTFAGAFKDGKFTGEHAEVNGEDAMQTGTLTLN